MPEEIGIECLDMSSGESKVVSSRGLEKRGYCVAAAAVGVGLEIGFYLIWL